MDFKLRIPETQKHHYLKSVQSNMYREQQTVVQCKDYTHYKTWYVPVHFMYWAEFQLAKASSTVQIKAI